MNQFFANFASTILVALIVSVIAPVILSVITNRQRVTEAEIANKQHREDRAEDYRRQDIVAARTEEVARVAAQNDERLAKATIETQGQLRVIHGLVNSSLTEALKAQLAALNAQLLSAEDVIRRKEAVGEPLGVNENNKLDIVRSDITELEAVLRDRHAAQLYADKQIAAVPSSGHTSRDQPAAPSAPVAPAPAAPTTAPH